MKLYRAPAKINLALEIIGKRPDGFHELVSVIQTVGLYDELAVSEGKTLQFDCNQNALAGPDNLVARAARTLQDVTGCQLGAKLVLHKNIPVAAGLGGGSSDAAVTMVALNQLWNTGLTINQLSEIGATLGSDITFFLLGTTAFVSGRGERVDPLPPPPPIWVVLVHPRQSLSTATVYAALTPAAYSKGTGVRRIAKALRHNPNRDWAADAQLENGLETTAVELCPAITSVQQHLRQSGALRTQISGSGPTVFTLCESESSALRVAANVTKKDVFDVWAVPVNLETTFQAIQQIR